MARPTAGLAPADGSLDVREIAGALEGNPGVSDWQIRKVRTIQHELYLIGEEVESVRRNVTESASAILYHDHDGGRGSATLTFVPGGGGACERVERAVFMASLTGNPPHQLPGRGPQVDVPVRDEVLSERPAQTIEDWSETLRRVAREEARVRLSSAEFFVCEDEVEFLNSRGAACSFAGTRAFIEFVLLSRAGDGSESENYHSLEVRAASALDLETVVRRRATLARDMLEVSLPGNWTGPVVISGQPLFGLLTSFLTRCNAELIYRKVFETTLGDNLLGHREVTGDTLDLAVDATLPLGLASAPIDDEGLPARRVQVLRGGRVENLLAAKRFADYLDIEPTGGVTNVVVGAGDRPVDELLRGPVFHLVAFADLGAHPLSGEFVSEIRLGYEISADGSVRPVKGGAVTGNVFDAFANCRLSRETIEEGRYHGPEAVRFEKLVIGG